MSKGNRKLQRIRKNNQYLSISYIFQNRYTNKSNKEQYL